MVKDAASAPHPLGRESEKTVGRGAAPLRLARREVNADVALAQCAENGVGESMQHHIAVRMGKNASIMGNADAAKPNVIAVPEGMDIEARAYARHHVHRGRSQPALGVLEIRWPRQLDVGRIALEHRYGKAGPLRESAIVREAVEPGFGSLAGRVQQGG